MWIVHLAACCRWVQRFTCAVAEAEPGCTATISSELTSRRVVPQLRCLLAFIPMQTGDFGGTKGQVYSYSLNTDGKLVAFNILFSIERDLSWIYAEFQITSVQAFLTAPAEFLGEIQMSECANMVLRWKRHPWAQAWSVFLVVADSTSDTSVLSN